MTAGIVPYQQLPFFNFFTGINTVQSVYSLKNGEFRDAQNIDLYPFGGFSKRLGENVDVDTSTVNAGDAAKAITSLYNARFSTAGGTSVSYLTCNTHLYKYVNPGTPGTLSDITGALTITYGVNNAWNWDILNDIVVGCNGVDSPIQISSASVAAALTAGMPFTSFKFPVQYRGYMFYFVPTVTGTVLYDRCYFSSLNDPTTVSTTNFIDIGKNNGSSIQGAIVYNGNLYVFKNNGIYQIIFQPQVVDSSGTLFPFSSNPNPVISSIGTKSHRSLCRFTTPVTHPTPGYEYVFFVDQYGSPRVFDGTTTLNFNSKIGSSLDSSLITLATMVKTQTAYSHSVNNPNSSRVMIWMSSANSQQNVTWILDYNYGFAMMRYKYPQGHNVSALLEKSDGTFAVFTGDYSSKIHILDVAATAADETSTDIDDYAIVDGIFLGNPSINSKFLDLNMRGLNASAISSSPPPSGPSTTLSYYIDGNLTAFKTDTLSLVNLATDTSTFPQTLTSEIGMVGKVLRIRIEATAPHTDFMYIEGFNIIATSLTKSHGVQV